MHTAPRLLLVPCVAFAQTQAHWHLYGVAVNARTPGHGAAPSPLVWGLVPVVVGAMLVCLVLWPKRESAILRAGAVLLGTCVSLLSCFVGLWIAVYFYGR